MKRLTDLEEADFYKAPSSWQQRVFSIVEKLVPALKALDN
jgi:hypothetical protein